MNKQQQTLFVISHVTISASEPDANGFADTRLFKTKKKALEQLKIWRNEELECRKNLRCNLCGLCRHRQEIPLHMGR